MQRLLAISGLVFVALNAASIFILPNQPDGHASAAKATVYFHAHKTAAGVSAHLILLAIFVGLFFFYQYPQPGSRRLLRPKISATVGFAGAVVFAVSGAVAAASYYTLGDAVAGHAIAVHHPGL